MKPDLLRRPTEKLRTGQVGKTIEHGQRISRLERNSASGTTVIETTRTVSGGGGSGAGDAATTTYTPADATDWTGSADPGNTDDALDQLADRVKTLEGGSGHSAVTLAADADAVLGLTGQQLTLDNQNANTVFAGPASGAAADPTFRALELDDVPYDYGLAIALGAGGVR